MKLDFSYFEKLNIDFSISEPLYKHSTFRIGGNADIYIKPKNVNELIEVLKFIKNNNIKFFILGKGSNILFDDDGFDGAVVSTEYIDSHEVNGNSITFGCGFSFTQASIIAKDNGLSGLEFAYGIPGSVGGAVFMNAGAYGGEVSQVLSYSEYLDLDTMSVCRIPLNNHKYGYRNSIYMDNPNMIVISATFSLNPLETRDIKVTMDDYMERRKSKQPLEYPSAGSVFKRCEGYFTGKLIEDLGLKGYSIGGAQISEKHAGFIINTGNAKSDDVLKLVDFIKSKVKSEYDLSLECELIHVK